MKKFIFSLISIVFVCSCARIDEDSFMDVAEFNDSHKHKLSTYSYAFDEYEIQLTNILKESGLEFTNTKSADSSDMSIVECLYKLSSDQLMQLKKMLESKYQDFDFNSLQDAGIDTFFQKYSPQQYCNLKNLFDEYLSNGGHDETLVIDLSNKIQIPELQEIFIIMCAHADMLASKDFWRDDDYTRSAYNPGGPGNEREIMCRTRFRDELVLLIVPLNLWQQW